MSSKPGPKQYCASCLCGCGSTASSTIAAHGKELKRRARLYLLGGTWFVSSHGSSSTAYLQMPPPTHRKPTAPVQPDGDASYSIGEPMDTDPPANGSGPNTSSSSPLTRVWADQAGHPSHEDKDLLPEPGPPKLLEDEGGDEDEGSDKPEFLANKEETPDSNGSTVHVEVSLRGLL